MDYRQLGNSGLSVSNLGLGTMTWGRDVDASTARHLVRTFLAGGGTLIDTSPAYGAGFAESLLGRLLAKGDFRRDEVVLASKGGFVVQGGERVIDNSRNSLLRDLEETLQRLRTDHLDLWQVHAWGDQPLDETLSALDIAVSKGMARYVGVSNFIGWQVAAASTWQQAVPGRADIVSAQIEYSLLARRAEVEIVGACDYLGMGLLAWSALGRGVLSGKYRTGVPRDSRGAKDHFAWFVQPYLEGRHRNIVEAVVTAAEGLGLSPIQVGLAWVKDAPVVSSALIGPRTVDQLEHLLAAADTTLPPAIVSALEDVSGGPNALRETAED